MDIQLMIRYLRWIWKKKNTFFLTSAELMSGPRFPSFNFRSFWFVNQYEFDSWRNVGDLPATAFGIIQSKQKWCEKSISTACDFGKYRTCFCTRISAALLFGRSHHPYCALNGYVLLHHSSNEQITQNLMNGTLMSQFANNSKINIIWTIIEYEIGKSKIRRTSKCKFHVIMAQT